MSDTSRSHPPQASQEPRLAKDGLRTHPFAAIFPALPDKDFQALKRSILTHGLLEPVTTYEDMVLDGANRARACAALGIEPRTEPYKGDDPIGFVVSKNLNRRHLTTSQRAMVSSKLADMRKGERTDRVPSEPSANLRKVSQAQAAKMLNVSTRVLQDAKVVLDHGSPDLVRAVEQGTIKVSAAKALITFPPEEQTRVAKETDPKVRRAKIKAAKKSATETKLTTKNTDVRVAELILHKLESAIQGLDDFLLTDGEYAQMSRWCKRLGSCDSKLRTFTARYVRALDIQRRAAGGAPVGQVAEAVSTLAGRRDGHLEKQEGPQSRTPKDPAALGAEAEVV